MTKRPLRGVATKETKHVFSLYENFDTQKVNIVITNHILQDSRHHRESKYGVEQGTMQPFHSG